MIIAERGRAARGAPPPSFIISDILSVSAYL